MYGCHSASDAQLHVHVQVAASHVALRFRFRLPWDTLV